MGPPDGEPHLGPGALGGRIRRNRGLGEQRKLEQQHQAGDSSAHLP